MSSLILTGNLKETFLGALITVCRADGEVNSDEIAALESAAGELTGGAAWDQEALLFSQVTPASFARALAGADGPFRAAGTSAPQVIGQAFVKAALRVCRSDGDLNESEVRSICAFARALGTSPNVLKDLDALLDDWLSRAEN